MLLPSPAVVDAPSLQISASSPTRPVLNQDVLKLIFDYLSHEHHALFQCSVVCRSWLNEALPRLYRDITHRYDRDDLAASPALARYYTRSLYFEDGTWDSDVEDTILDCCPGLLELKVYNVGRLPEGLFESDGLANLKKLWLSCRSVEYTGKMLSPKFHLDHLKMSFFRIPLQHLAAIITNSPRLKHLEFEDHCGPDLNLFHPIASSLQSLTLPWWEADDPRPVRNPLLAFIPLATTLQSFAMLDNDSLGPIVPLIERTIGPLLSSITSPLKTLEFSSFQEFSTSSTILVTLQEAASRFKELADFKCREKTLRRLKNEAGKILRVSWTKGKSGLSFVFVDYRQCNAFWRMSRSTSVAK